MTMCGVGLTNFWAQCCLYGSGWFSGTQVRLAKLSNESSQFGCWLWSDDSTTHRGCVWQCFGPHRSMVVPLPMVVHSLYVRPPVGLSDLIGCSAATNTDTAGEVEEG